MKYDEEIEREIRLEEQDLVDLFRDQESVDDKTRIYISNLDFIRALGRLDPIHQLTEEEEKKLRKEHGTPGDMLKIVSEQMETDYAPEERDAEFDRLLRELSLYGEKSVGELKDVWGEWVLTRLHDHGGVEYNESDETFDWADDDIYEGHYDQ